MKVNISSLINTNSILDKDKQYVLDNIGDIDIYDPIDGIIDNYKSNNKHYVIISKGIDFEHINEKD